MVLNHQYPHLLLTPSQVEDVEDAGEGDKTFEIIYDKLKGIKQIGETTASQASIEPEASSLPISQTDLAVLATICRLDTESSHSDTDGPKYTS